MHTPNPMQLIVLSLLASVNILTATAVAQYDVPRSLTLQGSLKDSSGAAVADGAHSVTFRIWNDPTATAPVNETWNSGPVNVTTTSGLFTVLLGAPPMPPLEPFDFLDTSLWLGITVDPHPEMSPRVKLASSAYAYSSRLAGNALVADSSWIATYLATPGATTGQVLAWDGGAWTPQTIDDKYVDESGDTVTGALAVEGDFSAGTDSVEAPITIRTRDNWIWSFGNGLGDLRISDGVRGFSLGIASFGGGAGHVRMWPSGGSQLITLGSPTSGDQLTIDGNLDLVVSHSPLSVNTNVSEAPLTVRTEDNWRWDIGTGKGDVRIGDGTRGLSIGVRSTGGTNGEVRLWASGGTLEDISFGSDTFGDIMQVLGWGAVRFPESRAEWKDALGVTRLSVTPNAGQLDLSDTTGGQLAQLVGHGHSYLRLWDEDYTETVRLGGGSADGGRLTIYRSDGNISADFFGGGAAAAQGGRLLLYDGAGGFTPTVSLYGDVKGDAAAILPDSAINHFEVLDEPGIAANTQTSPIVLTASMQDIATVTIKIPADGYVTVYGSGRFTTSGLTTPNDVYAQIDESAGGTVAAPHFAVFGLGGYVSTDDNYTSLSVHRVYQKTAGTYTFRLEALTAPPAGTAVCEFGKILAVYYPTSYGSVVTVADQPGDHPDARAVTVRSGTRGQSRSTTAYEMDLSYYERRATEAKIAALEAQKLQLAAELELAHARAREALEAAKAPE